jgi:hypothetical protein
VKGKVYGGIIKDDSFFYKSFNCFPLQEDEDNFIDFSLLFVEKLRLEKFGALANFLWGDLKLMESKT